MRIKRRGVVVGVLTGQTLRRLVRYAVDPDRVELRVVDLGVGEPSAVRRPGEGRQWRVATGIDLGHLAALDVDVAQTLLGVGERQLRAVRRPDRREAPGVAISGDALLFAATILRADVQLVLAATIAEVGD